jgi:putative endonuclease
MRQGIVYIITNKRNGTLYTGVTSDLIKRIYEHKKKVIKGFSTKYDCNLIVFYELHETIKNAIEREKQIKNYSRKKKLQLIESMNPDWIDLYSNII